MTVLSFVLPACSRHRAQVPEVHAYLICRVHTLAYIPTRHRGRHRGEMLAEEPTRWWLGCDAYIAREQGA
jgi:hypothetical protein